MANEWLRLWHDMPNDPKFRTVSKVAEQPVSLVISVYMHLLVSASRNVTRGHADVTIEDIASALDVKNDQVEAIFNAMQGRLLDGVWLTGWDKRQPKKEDAGKPETGAMSAAERKRLQREREKSEQKNNDVTECHDESRIVTTDKDKDKDNKKNKTKKIDLKFSAWIDSIRETGDQAIPDDDPIFDYAAGINLPDDYLAIAWQEFRAMHQAAEKKQSDWRATFRNYVRRDYLKLWWIQNGEYRLTTTGEKAMMFYKNNQGQIV